jgi:hypothetical protein
VSHRRCSVFKDLVCVCEWGALREPCEMTMTQGKAIGVGARVCEILWHTDLVAAEELEKLETVEITQEDFCRVCEPWRRAFIQRSTQDIQIHTYRQTYIKIHIHIHTHTRTQTNTYTSTHTRKNTQIHTHTHTQTHTHTPPM